jgi:hypothetical protein
MGTTLTGTTPQDTYDSLIKVTDNGPLSGTLKALSDGLGNDSTLSLSTTAASIAGTLAVTGASTFSSAITAATGSNFTGTAVNSRVIVTAAGVANTILGFNNSGTTADGVVNNAGYIGILQEYPLVVTMAGAERMRITSAGNVGIGTSAPARKLVVYDTDANVPTIGLRTDGSGTTTDDGFDLQFASSNTFLANRENGYMAFLTNNTERMRIGSGGEVSIGSTNTQARFNVSQTAAARIMGLTGNNNSQGAAQNYRVVRHYPVVSLGTKLIIPFVSQGSLNSTTFVRVFGHSAQFNIGIPAPFAADIGVGHLATIVNVTTISSTGNIALIASVGSNLEITFTTGYTSATADGIYVTLEYMTNNAGFSIDVANIAMN